MVVRKIAPALAAGCTVVLKPSDLTPLSALNVARILEEAGLPEGVLSVVCSRDPEPIGDQLLSDQRVKKITFTGSTEVGKHLLKGSADTVKRISLELGGNAPFIVFEDADLDAAVDGLMIAKMRNGGQSCIAANRIFVQRTVYDSFCAALVRRMATLKIGNGLDPAVTVGPLINKAAVDKVTRHVSDALANGAVLELGGRPPTGLFVEPTILGRVSDDMQVAQEETFGPITALTAFDDEEEVVRRANSDEYGLAAYYYTHDISRVFRLADDLEYGIQGVNDGFVSVAQAPFGGLKQSGLGREGGAEGIEEFIETKYLSLHL
jgi:succinate-semialdehyde dehydrogenase/glutarate-semialdehyde dehydrogenase